MVNSVRRTRILVLAVFVGLLAAVGCGGGTTVEGTVTYKGAPVEGAVVIYLKDDGSQAGQGISDASGKYRLVAPEGKGGVPAGTYTVTVTKSSMSGASVPDPKEGGKAMIDMMKGAGSAKSLLPAQFSQKGTSTLKKTVPSADYNLDLGS